MKVGVHAKIVFNIPVFVKSFVNITAVTVAGFQFSKSSLPVVASCSNHISDASFNASNEKLVLLFSSLQLLPSGSDSVMAMTCRIDNLVNKAVAISSNQILSVEMFGVNNIPLFVQTSITFPAIFDQSLGWKQPQVR